METGGEKQATKLGRNQEKPKFRNIFFNNKKYKQLEVPSTLINKRVAFTNLTTATQRYTGLSSFLDLVPPVILSNFNAQ